MERAIFHLSFPVRDLETSARFYVDVLGAKRGRRRERWTDVHLRGHQITLQLRPDEVEDDQGSRHFGLVIPWEEWDTEVQRLSGIAAPRGVKHSFAGTDQEQAKLFLTDPDGYVIELKSYRDPAAALEIAPERET
jgi:extradiol dioxygenase family protein